MRFHQIYQAKLHGISVFKYRCKARQTCGSQISVRYTVFGEFLGDFLTKEHTCNEERPERGLPDIIKKHIIEEYCERGIECNGSSVFEVITRAQERGVLKAAAKIRSFWRHIMREPHWRYGSTLRFGIVEDGIRLWLPQLFLGCQLCVGREEIKVIPKARALPDL